jgi:hypothetical protein
VATRPSIAIACWAARCFSAAAMKQRCRGRLFTAGQSKQLVDSLSVILDVLDRHNDG